MRSSHARGASPDEIGPSREDEERCLLVLSRYLTPGGDYQNKTGFVVSVPPQPSNRSARVTAPTGGTFLHVKL